MGLFAKTRTTLEMIKWEHSIFALPFALTAVLLASHGASGLAHPRLDPRRDGHRPLLCDGLQSLGRRRS